MGPWVEGGGEDEAQPLQAGSWIEELVLQLHWEGARWLIALGGSPVDQLSFRNREENVDWGGLSLERREGFLKEANVGSVRGGGHRASEVIDLGDNPRSGHFQVEGGDVYDEKEGGDGGSLRDPN